MRCRHRRGDAIVGKRRLPRVCSYTTLCPLPTQSGQAAFKTLALGYGLAYGNARSVKSAKMVPAPHERDDLAETRFGTPCLLMQ